VTIIHVVDDIKNKKEMPLADEADVKLILRVIEEFNDVALPTHLGLSSMGPLKFEKFCECLSRTVQDDWDAAIENKPETSTNAGFQQAKMDFAATHLDEDSLELQKSCVQTVAKADSHSGFAPTTISHKCTLFLLVIN